MNLQYLVKKKFDALDQLHLQSATQGNDISKLTEKTQGLVSRIKDVEATSMKDERHMTKYLPIQISALMYDVLRANFVPRYRPKLNEYFINLLDRLKVFIESGDQYIPKGGNLNFAFLDYSLPNLSKSDDYQGSPYNSDYDRPKKKKGRKVDS